VCYEDLFDKIKEFHIRTGHGGYVKLRNALHDTYYVPTPPIEIFEQCVKRAIVKNQ